MKATRLALACALLCTMLCGHAIANEDARPTLVFNYSAAIGERSALLRELAREQARRLQGWKKDGLLADYQLFFNRYADSGTWDAAAVLTFPDVKAQARWHKIERTAPGGLTPRAVRLVESIRTAQVDVYRQQRKGAATMRSGAFLVIPYQYLVSLGQYKTYLDDYAFPQFHGWMDEGVLEGFTMYIARYGAERPWSALLVLEYRDDTALEQRPQVTAKVRARLTNDPKWKEASDKKDGVREEGTVVVADQIGP